MPNDVNSERICQREEILLERSSPGSELKTTIQILGDVKTEA